MALSRESQHRLCHTSHTRRAETWMRCLKGSVTTQWTQSAAKPALGSSEWATMALSWEIVELLLSKYEGSSNTFVRDFLRLLLASSQSWLWTAYILPLGPLIGVGVVIHYNTKPGLHLRYVSGLKVCLPPASVGCLPLTCKGIHPLCWTSAALAVLSCFSSAKLQLVAFLLPNFKQINQHQLCVC